MVMQKWVIFDSFIFMKKKNLGVIVFVSNQYYLILVNKEYKVKYYVMNKKFK